MSKFLTNQVADSTQYYMKQEAYQNQFQTQKKQQGGGGYFSEVARKSK